MNIDITYRGSLASCDYECHYCPFAKTHDDAIARQKDKDALLNFVNWVESRSRLDHFKILITPWGEALIRKWYRESITKLSHMLHVDKVVIQTNLSASIDWLLQVNRDVVALWTTFHPSEASMESFVNKSHQLLQIGIYHSVGMVGTKENMETIQRLRETLDPSIYLWINAYKDTENYYTEEEVVFFESIDPYFELNRYDHPSFGQMCKSACEAISINHKGDVTPCHFVKQNLGNIYQTDLHEILRGRFHCPNRFCDCYIGYRHLKSLPIEDIYGDRALERIALRNLD